MSNTSSSPSSVNIDEHQEDLLINTTQSTTNQMFQMKKPHTGNPPPSAPSAVNQEDQQPLMHQPQDVTDEQLGQNLYHQPSSASNHQSPRIPRKPRTPSSAAIRNQMIDYDQSQISPSIVITTPNWSLNHSQSSMDQPTPQQQASRMANGQTAATSPTTESDNDQDDDAAPHPPPLPSSSSRTKLISDHRRKSSSTMTPTPNCIQMQPLLHAASASTGADPSSSSANHHKPVSGDQTPMMDVSLYTTKKNVAQGMLDIALLSANCSQLKYLLFHYERDAAITPSGVTGATSNNNNGGWAALFSSGGNGHGLDLYFSINLICLTLSIVLQVIVGILLILNSRHNVYIHRYQRVADSYSNWILLAVFVVTVVNIFLSVFISAR